MHDFDDPSNASVDEHDVGSIVAGPTSIVNPGVDDGGNVTNTVDAVNGAHGTKKKRNNKTKKKKKTKDTMIASTSSTTDLSLYIHNWTRHHWCQYHTPPVSLYH